MNNISKTKVVYYILIILGFVLPVSRTIFMQVPEMIGQLFGQLFSQIFFQQSIAPFNWLTLLSIVAVVSLLFHLFAFISIHVEKNEKNMQYYTITTLIYVVSGTLFLYNQIPNMFFVVIMYYLFLAVSSFFVKNF